MNFPEAVVETHNWADANNATVSITKAIGIDAGDGRIWSSFIIETTGAMPGEFAQQNPEITDFFMKSTEPFHFSTG